MHRQRTVFWDVVEVVSADNDCACHLRGDDFASEDTSTDGDVSGERALLVFTIVPISLSFCAPHQ